MLRVGPGHARHVDDPLTNLLHLGVVQARAHIAPRSAARAHGSDAVASEAALKSVPGHLDDVVGLPGAEEVVKREDPRLAVQHAWP